MATPTVGQDIEDHCGRCGDTWHVVAAMIGQKVAKVVCKLCGTQHNYKNIKATAAAAATGASPLRKVRKRKATVARAPAPIPTFDPSKPPRKYSLRESFAVGDRVEHPKFGIGIVSGSSGPGKIDVAFPDAPRVLACAKEVSDLARPTPVDVPISDRPPD